MIGVPPDVGPALLLKLATVGAGSNVKWSAADTLLIPPGVVTVTSTVPDGFAGEVHVKEVALETTTDVAGTAPKVTLAPGTNPVPETITTVPPETGPAVWLSDDTEGTGSNVYLSLVVTGLEPAGSVTTTSTVPDPGGTVHVRELALETEMLVA